MGERNSSGFGLGFNGSVRVLGRSQRVTADSGAILLRELDDALGMTSRLSKNLGSSRGPVRFSLAELLRSRVFLLALGYEAQSDVDLLRDDPALRVAVSDERGLSPLSRSLASQPTLSRFTRLIASAAGQRALAQELVEVAVAGGRLVGPKPAKRVLDIDSLPIAAHGLQGGAAYNGYYRERCFHPQVVMDGSGHLLAAKLRPGNESTSLGATELLGEVIERLEAAGERVGRVRGDAGFPSEGLLDSLERRRIGYAFRLTNNPALIRLAEPFLVRPPGRKPKEPREWTHVVRYQAQRWSRARRLVLVVQEREDDLFLHHFFLVTSDECTTGQQVLNFYRRRGTMEGRLGEWIHTIRAALSSSHRDGRAADPGDDRPFQANAATFVLSALAYNLLHTLRQLAAKARMAQVGQALGLGRARRLLLSVAGRIIVSARRAMFLVSNDAASMWSVLLARLRGPSKPRRTV